MHDDRGIYTTEFWITVGAAVTAAAVNVFPAVAWQGKVAIIAAAGFTAAKYVQGRSDLKSSIATSQTPPAAGVQVNTADSQNIAPQSISTSTVPVTSAPVSKPTTQPMKTTKPLTGKAIITLLLISLFACLPGCGVMSANPQCQAYRESLHNFDEPLYTAHTALMADAVKAGIRTPADQQVISAGIAQAEATYQQSKATDAAGATTGK